MLVRELAIGSHFKDMLEGIGVTQLYPPQELSVKAGILDGKNIILCTPTASGKTIAAELAMMRALQAGGKAVYIVPLRALAYEKNEEFKKYAGLGYKVRMEVGDLDSKKYGKAPDFDILVATAEKCDSILRSKPDWFRATSVIVLDEIHLIASDRGPVYEVLCSKFRNIYPSVQVLGLSATVGNAQELADWLNAEHVQSTWRPVDLEEKVAVKSETSLESVVAEYLGEGQVMVFVNSRKSAESVAEKLAKALSPAGDEEAAKNILSALSPSTKQCRRLAECVRSGTAFHHAGLVNSQRQLVEDAFKNGSVKVIAATPTLAAGVNLPSRTVVVRDLKRYTGTGLSYINVLEYKQMVGRAGRPRYDDHGNAVTLAKDEAEAEYVLEHYVGGEPENIYSQLGIHPVLRFHSLASIASGFTRTHDALTEFMRSTFFGHQYGVRSELEQLLEKICVELTEWGFVNSQDRFLTPTDVGARVSELYVDPLTAHNYIRSFTQAEKEGRYPVLGLLEVLCDAVEMFKLRVRNREEAGLWEMAYSCEDELLRDLSGFGLDYDFLNRFKTARMFMDWISEKTEEQILEEYSVTPGQLNMRLQNMRWLAYAGAELTRILGMRGTQTRLKRLESMVTYGVSEELVPLVSVRGLGRVRARKLYDSGVKTLLQLKRCPESELAQVIGKGIAKKIKQEL